MVEEGRVESVKRRRVVKRRSKQMEIVDWALWRRLVEFVRMRGEDERLKLLGFLVLVWC